MQDGVITAIGWLQIKRMKDLEEVYLYIEDMYRGRDYNISCI